ncbi:MAG: hypothetical protein AAB373_01540 [Patescibacteria group bacterium]
MKNLDNSWQIIHQQFSQYGKTAKEWLRKCALLLPEIEKQKIWQKKGFSSIYVYAYQIAGMNQGQVEEALRVLHRIADKPALMKIAEEKGLQSIRPVAVIATAETQEFWAEKAKVMSKNTLEAYVQAYRKEFLPREENLSVNIGNAEINMSLDPTIADKLSKLKGQGNWNELMKKFIEMHEKNLEENKPKAITVNQAPKAYKSRAVPSKMKKHILAKTNSTCAFPGCSKPYKILHHTNRYALNHTHDPDTITPLCKAHEGLAHLGLIENENKSPQSWKLRTEPDYNDPKYKIDQIVGEFRQH